MRNVTHILESLKLYFTNCLLNKSINHDHIRENLDIDEPFIKCVVELVEETNSRFDIHATWLAIHELLLAGNNIDKITSRRITKAMLEYPAIVKEQWFIDDDADKLCLLFNIRNSNVIDQIIQKAKIINKKCPDKVCCEYVGLSISGESYKSDEVNSDIVIREIVSMFENSIRNKEWITPRCSNHTMYTLYDMVRYYIDWGFVKIDGELIDQINKWWVIITFVINYSFEITDFHILHTDMYKECYKEFIKNNDYLCNKIGGKDVCTALFQNKGIFKFLCDYEDHCTEFDIADVHMRLPIVFSEYGAITNTKHLLNTLINMAFYDIRYCVNLDDVSDNALNNIKNHLRSSFMENEFSELLENMNK